jgi:hypothetical protein
MNTPGAAWYRILGIDPFCVIFMWSVTGNVGLFVVFAVLGTGWWYFIGRIGWASKERKISRVGSALGAVLVSFTAYFETGMSGVIVRQDLRDGGLSTAVILQYVFVGLLCLGAWLSAICSFVAVLRRRDGTMVR